MRSSYSTPAAFISPIFCALQGVELLAQHVVGILEDRLDQREHVERVGGALAVEAPSVSTSQRDSAW
jgi:hypothetical protein